MHIREIHLLTNDIEGTRQFYTEKLDAPIDTINETSISFLMGSTRLTFTLTEKMEPYYHIAFDVPNNQLEEALDWTRQRIPILPISGNSVIVDYPRWDARSFYFYDNNGNILEFIDRYEVPSQSSEPFAGSSILYASEVGIAVENVATFSDQLIEQYGVELFKKQPRLQNFAAVGTDTGLFIISTTNRNWYPVDRKALPFPTKVIFEVDGRVMELAV
jgi:catechol 2,3-dioxygenase-like lactoylglutathione lyase family enzyme